MKIFKFIKYKAQLNLIRSFFYKNATFSTHSNDLNNLSKIRNLGIIAHIDGGKTTTTERMLYYSGLTKKIGDVDSGDTVTDYMEQERNRGITINSSAIQINWNNFKMNLIDTPGHVDFTFEVERCLSVLDGSIVILDASAGVEAQTLTVWGQSQKYKIPKIIYLNKMDKPKADYEMCLQSIKQLQANPILVNLPLFEKNQFIGIIDIINLKKHIWDLKNDENGSLIISSNLESIDPEYKKTIRLREDLIGQLTEYDEKLSEKVLDFENLLELPSNMIINALRRCTIKEKLVPVFMGSSYKNIGVQLLLDSVIKYLPSPIEKNTELLSLFNGNLCAFIFKIVYHKAFGYLSFVRIYSGSIKPLLKVHNYTQNVTEKISKIFIPFANEYEEIQNCSYGNIAVVSGFSNSKTGDLLVFSREYMKNIEKTLKSKETQISVSEKNILNGINLPEPVFFCSIEAPSPSKQKSLEIALERMQKEDPSFSVNLNKETNQTVISGMGELHLDVIKKRILSEYKLDTYFGDLEIAYRESIEKPFLNKLSESKSIKNVKQQITIELLVKPEENLKKNLGKLKVVCTEQNNLNKLKPNNLHAIEDGLKLAVSKGPILGFPVLNVAFELHQFECSYGTFDSIITSVTEKCVQEAFQKCNPYLLEPIMKLEISVPEELYGLVLNELTLRRSTLGESNIKNNRRFITAFVPLVNLIDFSSVMRTLCSGKANFSMHLYDYQKMTKVEENAAILKVNIF